MDFDANSVEDMSLVTAMIRPSGSSYRDKLVKKIPNKNPSKIIDDLLEDSYGYLVYQEQIIAFLQLVCNLSGSDADNVRRAVARKDKDRLDKAMPQILEGYCSKSDKSREIAEEEAKTFLKVIEDASSYMFGYNHSIGYTLLSYLCAYYRHYHIYEFLTAAFNCSESEEDLTNGTELATLYGIKIKEPKFRYSKAEYFFDKDSKSIYKGMKSIKYLNESCANDLYELRDNQYDSFIDLLYDIDEKVSINSRQLEILIKLDYFSEFGNAKELLGIVSQFDKFKQGKAKTISKDKIENDKVLYGIVERHSKETAKKFSDLDNKAILNEVELYIKGCDIKDFTYREKMETQKEYLGYINVSTGSNNIEDRKKLIVLEIIKRKSKESGKIWGYTINTQSVGSGKHGSFTIRTDLFDKKQLIELDIIYVKNFFKNKKGYWYLTDYDIIDGV